MSRLSGKIALVTGSTSGVGAAIARLFTLEGALVAIHGIEPEAGAALAQELGTCYFSANLGEPSQCERLIDEVASHFGRLDILVNNAAIVPRADLGQTDAATFDQVLSVNLRAPLLLIRRSQEVFRRHGGGVVLNIGSVNAYCGESELLAYSISKGALMTLTRNLADALGGENIRVNQLNPGWVLTEREDRDMVARGHPADWADKVSASFAPSGRIFAPEEIASFALAFTEERGGFVSGTVADLQQYPMIGRNPNKTPND